MILSTMQARDQQKAFPQVPTRRFAAHLFCAEATRPLKLVLRTAQVSPHIHATL